MNRLFPRFLITVLGVVLMTPGRGLAVELSVDDFRFDGPLGSAGAKVEKLAENHFQIILGHAPSNPGWANDCQFQITRHAKGNRLRLVVRFEPPTPKCNNCFDEAFQSWSYDGANWQAVQWQEKPNGKRNELEFPRFEEDRVHVGIEVPMSYEDSVGLLENWAKHPCAKLHILGKSLGGRNLYRLEITDPESPHPRRARWGHYFANQHPSEHNSQWRMAGMIDWLLSDAGTDLRRRSVCHFILMMSPDGPSQGWDRCNGQGVDMNRSYRAAGADPKEQPHEAYIFQKDLEGLMASDVPPVDLWSMHCWPGKVECILTAGPEMGTLLEPKERFAALLAQNDTKHQIKPLKFKGDGGPTFWSAGAHRQFGVTSVLCEGTDLGADGLYTKQENLDSGVTLLKTIDQYYRGARP